MHVHVPVPTPRKDEVLLKVEASSLNAFDWKIKKGVARPILPRKFPYIPATDVAGEIIEVGSEVKNFKAGYNVVAILNHFSGGGLAEFAMVKESLTASRPLEVSAAEGAGLPLAGLTALEALTQSAGVNLDGSGQQKNILITAASGATCGARNIEFVKSLGADEVLDYKTPDGAALKSPSGRKYDAVIQCATGIPWSTFEPNLAKNGKVIDLTPGPSAMLTFAWQKLTFSKKQLVPLLVIPKGENLVFLVKLLKEGKIKTLIDSKHLLGKAEDAWGKSADGHATGKIILEP
ncbi:chloroplast envelope quinone oxidoreductase-like [Citrus sinensis]|uniref:Chloroplast envelope quinone oxidoreductase-like n=1 Tax=Citrus sinensis TaxID=2711 RepID=A0ACB8MH35_CITSI|nr:chloroplast envelope quinone oxidoreductase-like [Citrus sinensis]